MRACGVSLQRIKKGDGRAGSERATEMHGLMEGAVRSGERVADEVVAYAA